MIRLGLRLTLGGGREAAVRLVVIAAAVALGVVLLLICLAGLNALNAQNARYAWLSSAAASTSPARPADATTPAPDPLWWLLRVDYFAGQMIGRVDVGATGPSSPVPPGIPRLPGPGQFYASPALSQLLRSTPADELGGRFPGHQIGTIGRSALPAPNSLIIIIGRRAGQLGPLPGAVQVTSINSTPPSGCHGNDCALGGGINANGIDLVLSVVAAGLLLPVLIFIATATRLSAARREQRFAAMRLVGATPRQIAVLAAVESAVAAVAGVAAGLGLFFLLRPAVAALPFTGAPFFPSDLSLSPADVLVVAVGVPAAAAAAARLALRQVQISPLGAHRRVTPAAPRPYRVIPLLAGIGELAVVVGTGAPRTTRGQIEAFLPGLLLILAGLVIAGPWLTMVGARVMARRARRPATLIAARRLADNPRAGFRAISGLILALFVTTVAVGVTTTIVANRGAPGGPIGSDILAAQLAASPPQPGSAATVPDALLAGLRSVRGVQGVTVIHTNPLGIALHFPRWGSTLAGLVSCAELSRTPALGRCPAGAQAAAIPPQGFAPGGFSSSQTATVWPAAHISARRLPVQSIAVGTNGSTAAIEQARTLLEVAYPKLDPPTTLRETYLGSNLAGWQQLANVVILASLAIAGCTLAASVAGGLNDRKRPFSLLRLTGVPLGILRRVVVLESAVPLLIVAIVSTGAGFLAAQLYLTTQLHYSLRPPGTGYYLIVLAGLAAALAIITATLPLFKRITGPETARNE